MIVPDAVLLTAVQSGVFQPDSRLSCVPVSTAKQPAHAPSILPHRSSKYRSGSDAINRKGSESRVGLSYTSRLTDILEPAAKPESGSLIGLRPR